MTQYEYGSIFVKSPKLQLILDEISQMDLTKTDRMSFAIVGETGSGKSTMAEHIRKLIYKNRPVAIQKNIEKAAEVQAGSTIFTTSNQTWIRLRNEIHNENLKVIVMPSLKDRKQDLAELADFFIKVLCLMNGRPTMKLTEKATEMILQYSWPGQFHEFEAILESAFEAALLDSALMLEPQHLNINKIPQNFDVTVGMKLEEIERNFILQTLYFVHQNRTKAAEILGISIRTLRNKINQYRQEGYL